MLRETENEFLSWVVDLARLCHWEVWHQLRSKGTAWGFPDLLLIRRTYMEEGEGVERIWAELKSERGNLTPEQDDLLEALRDCGDEVYVWWPSDRPAIEERLKG